MWILYSGLFGFTFLLGFMITTYAVNGRLRRAVNHMFYYNEDAFHYNISPVRVAKAAKVKATRKPAPEPTTNEVTLDELAKMLREHPDTPISAGGNHEA